MIEFDCPHCGNPFKARDRHAGRDGWCRVCKRLVIVPQHDGTGLSWEQLTLDEKVERLDKKLQYAASQADYYKILIAKFCEKLHKVITGDTVRFHQVDHDLLMSYLSKTQAAMSNLRSSSGIEAEDAIDVLGEDADDFAARADQATSLHEAELRIEELEAQLEANQASNLEAEGRIERLKENLESKEQRLEDLSKGLDESSETDTADAGLVEALQNEVDSLTQARDEATAQRGALSEELNSMVAELDVATRERGDAEELADQQSKQIDSLRAELTSVLEAAGDETGPAHEISGTQDDAVGNDDHARQLKEKDSELEKMCAEVEEQSARVEVLQSELLGSSELTHGFEAQLAEKEEALEEFSSKLSEALEQRQGVEAQAVGLEKELDSIREERALSVRLHDETQKELKLRESEAADLRAQLSKRKVVSKRKNAALSRTLQQTVDELTTSKDGLQQELKALEKDFRSIGREAEEARQAFAEAEGVKARLEEELADGSAALEELTESASKERDALHAKLAAAEATIERLAGESLATIEQEASEGKVSFSRDEDNRADFESSGFFAMDERLSSSDIEVATAEESDDEGNPMVASYLRFLNSR